MSCKGLLRPTSILQPFPRLQNGANIYRTAARDWEPAYMYSNGLTLALCGQYGVELATRQPHEAVQLVLLLAQLRALQAQVGQLLARV